jgi:hypothetical protein
MRCPVAFIAPGVMRFDCEEEAGHSCDHWLEDEHGLNVTWPSDHPMSRVTDPETGMPITAEVKG